MNIAVECPECCECPAPIFRKKARSKALLKYGFGEVAGYVSTIPKRYKDLILSGTVDQNLFSSGSVSSTVSGGLHIDNDGVMSCDVLVVGTADVGYWYPDHEGPGGTRNHSPCFTTPYEYLTWAFDVQELFFPLLISFNELRFDRLALSGYATLQSVSATGKSWSLPGAATTFNGSFSATLSTEYTTAMLWENVLTALAALSFGAPATSFNVVASKLLSINEQSAQVEDSKVEIRFPIPKVGNGKCSRVEWVSRFVPKVTRDPDTSEPNGGGASIDSVEILNRGVYRPVAYVFGDGDGAEIVPVMASNGAIASIRILNPGSGYTSPPEIDFSGSGGAEAEAVIDADAESPNYGRLIAVNVTNAGNYLPTLTFSSPADGGTVAEAVCTLNPQGGIASLTLTQVGAFYESWGAGISIDAPAVQSDASLFVHFGEETAYSHNWDGVTPEGYDEEDIATWPVSEEIEFPVPEEEGDVAVEVKRYACKGCP
jgi:hypothetical protein